MFTIKKPLYLFLLLSLASSAFAQTAAAPSKDPLEANLRRHVEYLASDKLEGRRTGERGATTAAGYVVNQFAKAKLKPGFKASNGKATYLQPFPYIAGVTLGKDNFLRIIPTADTRESKMKVELDFQPFANSIKGYVPPAPLVFAGYGVATADKSRDDYAGLDVKGKIVLVADGTPDANNPHSNFAGINVHTKANIAKERGAKALIVISRTDDLKLERLAQLSYEPTTGETAIPVVIVTRSSVARLFNTGLGEVESSMESGKAPLPAITATAQVKVDLVKKQSEAYNVIGVLEGTDPTLKNEAIVIGAHYDHLGHGGQGSLSPNTKDIHHGADDNASGTSAVIELARMFKSEPGAIATGFRNKRTIIFIAFGGEEEGLLGSKYYVNHPTFPIDKTIAMINLDMVGRLNENKLTVGGIGTATEMKALVEDLNGHNRVGVEKHSYAAPSFNLQLNEDGFGPSDHSSFYGKQIPVLFLFTGTHLDYHKPTDTAEKINYSGLTKITQYAALLADSIDQNPTRPTYKVAQSSGQMGARTTFSVSLGTIPSYADGNDGLTIDGVRDGGPGAKAGLKGGDKIIKLAGKDVRNISDYMFAMSTMKAGDEYEVVVKRGDETLTMKIVPAAAARR